MKNFLKALLVMAVIVSLPVLAGVPNDLMAELSEYTDALQADGVIIDWDKALVMSMDVKGKPVTVVTLVGILNRRQENIVTMQYYKLQDEPPMLIVGLAFDSKNMTSPESESLMVVWMSQTGEFAAMKIKMGLSQPVPSEEMSSEEAEKVFARYLPKTYELITKKFLNDASSAQ